MVCDGKDELLRAVCLIVRSLQGFFAVIMGKKSKQKKNNNTMSLVEFMATNVDDERKLDKMTKDPRLLNLPTRPKG